MTSFTPKILHTELSCGQLLKQARLEKGWSIKDVFQKTNIKESYLQAIEDDRFDELPAGLYGRNFVGRYAKFLKLNTEKMVSLWQEQAQIKNKENPFSRKIIARKNFIIFPKLLRNLFVLIAVAICFLYLIFYFKKVISPPKLEITYPISNLSLNESSIVVTGETEKEAEVSINGELILNNNNGFFQQAVNLKKGLNNVVIKAKKKYSQEETITRQILVE